LRENTAVSWGVKGNMVKGKGVGENTAKVIVLRI